MKISPRFRMTFDHGHIEVDTSPVSPSMAASDTFYWQKQKMVITQLGLPLRCKLDRTGIMKALKDVRPDAVYYCRHYDDTDALSVPHPFARIGNGWYSLLTTPYGKQPSSRLTRTFVWKRPVDAKPIARDHQVSYAVFRLLRQQVMREKFMKTTGVSPLKRFVNTSDGRRSNLPERLVKAVQDCYPEIDAHVYLRGVLDTFRFFVDVEAMGVLEETRDINDIDLNSLLSQIYPPTLSAPAASSSSSSSSSSPPSSSGVIRNHRSKKKSESPY